LSLKSVWSLPLWHVMGKGKISWEWKKLGEGAFRWAFPGKVVGGPWGGFKEGTDIVVKVIKTSAYKDGHRVSQKDIDAQQLAGQYAEAFNQECCLTKEGQSCKVHVRVCKLTTADSDKSENGVRRIVAGERMQVEQRIFGKYEKFNSNSGWSSGTGLAMDFFSHWTYRHSGRKFLVCDLQGYRGMPGGPKYGSETYYYLLTDPAVLSSDGRYGDTDLGSAGIASWFSQHKCNALCKQHGLDKVRPGQNLKRACMRRSAMRFDF